jgi:hypothetical protein
MDLAARENGTFASLRGNAMVASLALVPGPAGPLWVLAVGSGFGDGSDGDAAFAVVDANSGNVSTTDDLNALMEATYGGAPADTEPVVESPYYHPRANRTFVKTESGSAQGTLTVASPGRSAEFEVDQAGHGKLVLQLDLPRALPPTQASAVVTAPDGRTSTLAFTAGLTGSAPARAELETPQPGHYRVAIRLDAGILQDYTFSWCAPGSRMAAQDASSACGQA